tara:strand:- start:728 stop:1750 length:1023 start_codon:yes stop_codon:yes gene_type:complete
MNKTIIIAEAGVNHNGSIEIAKKLIDVAAHAKADYVKFQTFKTENVVSKFAKKANYQIKNLNSKDEFQYEMIKSFELNYNDFNELIKYSKKKKIKFLSTAFDLESLDYLFEIGIDLFKIPSGEITNYQYLKKIASFNKSVILSTGMSTINEIESALNILCSEKLKKENITILHCNTDYPTKLSDVNLRAMLDIEKKFNTKIGYSDHTLGITVPLAAVSLGARIIEKHFTIDRGMVGPDHAASLEPKELIEMINAIRDVEVACSGSGIKTPSKNESKNKEIARRSVFLKKNVYEGDIINEKMLIALRPGDGISPMEIPKILGKKIKNDLKSLTKLDYKHFI